MQAEFPTRPGVQLPFVAFVPLLVELVVLVTFVVTFVVFVVVVVVVLTDEEEVAGFELELTTYV